MCTTTTIVLILHFGHRRKCLPVSVLWDLAIVFPVEASNPNFMTAQFSGTAFGDSVNSPYNDEWK